MHERDGFDWFSVSDITRLAAPTTAEEGTSLPAGSDFLTSERMIRAITEMGFQPLCLDGKVLDGKGHQESIGGAILPYVESGLPVVLGLEHGQGLGHAVTVIGRVFSIMANPTNRPLDYIPAFVAHDDQSGPYMLVPTSAATAGDARFDKNSFIKRANGKKAVTLNVKKHGVFAVALMPPRVFSTAKEAERIALGRFNAAMGELPKIRSVLTSKNAQVPHQLLDDMVAAHKRGDIIFRTYLTSAAGYRRHIAMGTACDNLKTVLLKLHLPHFTWITEFTTVGSYNHASPGLRRIYGHSIFDATSSGRDTAGLMMMHIPGVVFLRDAYSNAAPPREIGIAISGDALYECRDKDNER